MPWHLDDDRESMIDKDYYFAGYFLKAELLWVVLWSESHQPCQMMIWPENSIEVVVDFPVMNKSLIR
ncbi:hypothetical protein [Xenorhabdus bovienii]|uniref:hypothetical protein n=1 Tax=Xenorhabdus bovienii TaxID=40576 RepID=UPI00117F1C52|nr:hypothetical protein [Xenorhabdus bovienii]